MGIFLISESDVGIRRKNKCFRSLGRYYSVSLEDHATGASSNHCTWEGINSLSSSMADPRNDSKEATLTDPGGSAGWQSVPRATRWRPSRTIRTRTWGLSQQARRTVRPASDHSAMDK